MDIFEQLPQRLLPWYEENRRDLPWRADRDPYHIWVSEIMLQQTRVEAVKGYYARFLEAVPTVSHLAQAEDDLLRKLWEGLGYYSRVRNLKKAAQVIMGRFDGVFPREYEDVFALPGIGAYTAGAICSIAFDQKRAAVDGNVLRVVTRLTEDATPIDQEPFRRKIRRELEEIYPEQAGMFTQALMELGATVCVPNGAPRCDECPCRDFCGSYNRGTTDRYPVKGKKISQRLEERTVFVLSCDGAYALARRPEQGLLAGLWEFPHVMGHLGVEQALEQVRSMGLAPREIFRQVRRKHIFTHIRWELLGYYLEVERPEGAFCWMDAEQVEKEAALPTAFRQFWEEISDV